MERALQVAGNRDQDKRLQSTVTMESENRIESEVESPFQDKIDLELFYGGTGRGDILRQLQDAVAGGAPLMVLSGSEGSGKTTMCRMLERNCRASLAVVFFATTVESFEDVVRNIAAALLLPLAEAEEGRAMDGAVEQIVGHLSREEKGLLLVFDQAEDIYLATLERIRKMLDRVTAAGVRMQILFSGRKTFLENCDQLSICDFRNSEGIHVDLPPLSEEQTAEYLRNIADKTLPAEKRRVFNDEVVRNIHNLAKGRPRRINLLAQESLRSHGNDTSFMALLDSVRDDLSGDETEKRPVRRLAGGSSFFWWLGGGAVVLALVLLVFRPTEKVKLREQAAVVSGAVAPVAEGEKAIAAHQEKTQPAEVSPKETAEKAAEGQAASTGEAPKPPEVLAKVEVSENTAALAPATTADAAMEKVAAVVEAAPSVPVAPAPEVPVKAPARENAVAKPPELKVVVLKQIPPIKMRPASWTEEQADSGKPAGKNEGPDPTGTLTVDQLYQKRLQAGTTWTGNEKKEKFTVQLMVLTAKNAEANFKKMLTQANYRQEAGNFYIFKKNGSPEVVWVFYGEYPSLEVAKVAQNSLPPFLREHQPYAIAVKGAIGKVAAK